MNWQKVCYRWDGEWDGLHSGESGCRQAAEKWDSLQGHANCPYSLRLLRGDESWMKKEKASVLHYPFPLPST